MQTEEFYTFSYKSRYSTPTPEIEYCLSSEHDRYQEEENLHHALLTGNTTGLEFPIVFRQQKSYWCGEKLGDKLKDVLGTYDSKLFLISDRLKALLEARGFTGWKTYPIVIWNKNKERVSGYHGFSVTGRCGEIDWSKAQIVERDYNFYKCHRGIPIDSDIWDGSDFFTGVSGSYMWDGSDSFTLVSSITVTKRVKQALEDQKISNTEFIKLNYYLRDIRHEVPKRFHPGLLLEKINQIADPTQRQHACRLVKRLYQQSVRDGIEEKKTQCIIKIAKKMLTMEEPLEKIQQYTGLRNVAHQKARRRTYLIG